MNMATKTSIVLPKSVTLTAEQAEALLKSGIQTTITVTTTKEQDERSGIPSFADRQTTIDGMQSEMDKIVKRNQR